MKKFIPILLMLIFVVSPVLALNYTLKRDDVSLNINNRGFSCGTDPEDNEIYCCANFDNVNLYMFDSDLNVIYSKNVVAYVSNLGGCTVVNRTHAWYDPASITNNALYLIDFSIPSGNPFVTITSQGSYTGNALYSSGLTKSIPVLQKVIHDDFETGNYSGGTGWANDWQTNGSVIIATGSSPFGTYHIRLQQTGSINRTFDSLGYEFMNLTIWVKASNSPPPTTIPDNECCFGYYFDGVTTTLLGEGGFCGSHDPYQLKFHDLPLNRSANAVILFDNNYTSPARLCHLDEISFDFYNNNYETYWANQYINNVTGHHIATSVTWGNPAEIGTMNTENPFDISRVWIGEQVSIGSNLIIDLWNLDTATATGDSLNLPINYPDIETGRFIRGWGVATDVNDTIWLFYYTDDASSSSIWDLYKANLSEAIELGLGIESVVSGILPELNGEYGVGGVDFKIRMNTGVNGTLEVYRESLELEIFAQNIYNETVTGNESTQDIDFSHFFADEEMGDWVYVATFTDINTNIFTTGEIPFSIGTVGAVEETAEGIGDFLGIEGLENATTFISLFICVGLSLVVIYFMGQNKHSWQIFIISLVVFITAFWYAGFLPDVIMLIIVSFIVLLFANTVLKVVGSGGG